MQPSNTFQEGLVAPEPSLRRIEGVRCDSSAECQAKDVNLVCRFGLCQDWDWTKKKMPQTFVSGNLLKFDLEIVQLSLCQLQLQPQLKPVVRI